MDLPPQGGRVSAQGEVLYLIPKKKPDRVCVRLLDEEGVYYVLGVGPRVSVGSGNLTCLWERSLLSSGVGDGHREGGGAVPGSGLVWSRVCKTATNPQC